MRGTVQYKADKWGGVLESWNQGKHDELQKEVSFLLGEITKRIHRMKPYAKRSKSPRNQNEMLILIEDGLAILRQTQQMLLDIAEFVIQTKKYTISADCQAKGAEFSSMRLLNESVVLLKDQAQCLAELLINLNMQEEKILEEKIPSADSAAGIH